LIQIEIAWQVPQNITISNSLELFWGRDATVLCRAFNTMLR
jgi:hypothetical protein